MTSDDDAVVTSFVPFPEGVTSHDLNVGDPVTLGLDGRRVGEITKLEPAINGIYVTIKLDEPIARAVDTDYSIVD